VRLFDQIARQHYSSPPDGWATKRLKFLADVRTSNVDKVVADDEEPVLLCNYTDVYYNDRITVGLPFMEATATSTEIEKFTLKAGQVIITKDSEGWDDIGIPALVPNDLPGVVCGYHLAVLTPDHRQLDSRFLAWLCRADPLNDQFKLSANGVTRFALGHYPMKNAVIGYPSIEAQRRISDFLDERTEKIDALVEAKGMLLQSLEEKRQTIITEAVTRGLDPAAPMKESRIGSFGEIPRHWQVERLKFRATKIGSGVTPRGGASVYQDEGILLLRSQNVRFSGLSVADAAYIDAATDADMSATRVRSGDVLLNITGASIGRCCVYEIDRPANVNQHVCIIRCNENTSGRFVAYFLASMVGQALIDMAQNGASREGLSLAKLGSFPVPIPDFEEQEAIALSLDTATAAIDEACVLIHRSIAQLEELRSALITRTVTGHTEGLQ
jgi:type I restriction enzyme S subunit